MKVISALGLMILLLFPCGEASAQPRRTLLDAGAAGKVEAVPQQGRGEALRLVRGNRTLWEARDQRFAAFRNGAAIPLGNGGQAIGMTGWTGGAYCCWTLHLFRRTPQGLSHLASLPLGKREPDVIRLAVPGGPAVQVADAAFDFWDAPASRATDLHPTVPFRWTGQALEPNVAAMRRPIAAALGTACIEMAAPGDMPPPERRVATYPDTEAAIAELGGREWSRGPGATGPHPGVEAARLATCLIYSGQAAEARRLLRTVWPEGAPGLAETERQITARLACSPFVAAVRAANPPGAPYVGGRCTPNSPAQTALYALNWR